MVMHKVFPAHRLFTILSRSVEYVRTAKTTLFVVRTDNQTVSLSFGSSYLTSIDGLCIIGMVQKNSSREFLILQKKKILRHS
jgi:hypothetical protein